MKKTILIAVIIIFPFSSMACLKPDPKELFAAYDSEKNGKVSFDEYLKVKLEEKKGELQLMEPGGEEFDPQDVITYKKQIEENFSDSNLKKNFSEIDANKDGSIDFSEIKTHIDNQPMQKRCGGL